MFLATSLQSFPNRRFDRTVLTLGVFDGIHMGHQKVLREVRRETEKTKGTAALLTFQEHPQKILKPGKKTSILTSFWHKLNLIRCMGIDLCVAVCFNLAFSKLSPDEFVKKILIDCLKVKKVILGHDSRFGHNREGDTKTMTILAQKYGFDFSVVPPVRKAGFTVSSTRIRRLISDGQLDTASKLLGRPYSILASVVRGKGRGEKLGFPTANLDLSREVLPPRGVYVARVRAVRFRQHELSKGLSNLEGETGKRFFPAVLNLGLRPTFEARRVSEIAEVHILQFHGDLYGKTIEVEFLKQLRKEVKFKDASSLQGQIVKDIRLAERFFETYQVETARRRENHF